MQERSQRRSNRERSEATRAALMRAARTLFVEKGFADTGTPEIVAAAQVTRGALYHHFADKTDLFRAVVIEEARTVAREIERETARPASALDALLTGAQAYFTAMSFSGRTRLLLRDGPAVLGYGEMERIDRETGGEELRQGLAFALTGAITSAGAATAEGAASGIPLEALTGILSAAFDRAALAIAEGQPAEDYRAAITLILKGLLEGR
jgi:AcrR family transcriptional regulator